MFQNYYRKEIEFTSNPPFPDEPSFVPDSSTGVVKNHLKYVPKSHRSIFEGVKFDSTTMGLRAVLNAGVILTPVNIGQIENDPTKLMASAIKLENQITSNLEELQSNELHSESTNS